MPSDVPSPETVYVFGAGCSYHAQVPLQAEILNSIRDMGFVDVPFSLVEKFFEAQGIISGFLSKVFERVPNPSLEDVFTLLDQSIQHRSFCVGYSWQELERVRRSLEEAIVVLFHAREQSIPSDALSFYETLGAYLIERRVSAGQANHPFSIVSLNWDCVLERAIYGVLEQCEGSRVDIDYCCYTTPFEGTTRHTPSLHQKAIGLNNIKLMKLHGSVNCMICPNCNRLYAGLGVTSEMMTDYLVGKICPRCQKLTQAQSQDIEGPLLEPFIVTPTFVKEFESAHLQMIWHNAYVDLCEAAEIVFIGYSLPEADYHVRTLMKRAIRPDASITVVLVDSDNPPADCAPHIRHKYAASRYEAFFGSEPRVSFEFGGVKGYFQSHTETTREGDRFAHLRRMLAEPHR